MVELPYLGKELQTTDFGVDTTGNAYLVGLHFLSNVMAARQNKEGVKHAEAQILCFNTEGALSETLTIETGQKTTNALKLDVNSAGDLQAIGFYSNVRFSKIDGYFSCRIDGKTKAIQQNHFHKFENEVGSVPGMNAPNIGGAAIGYQLRALITTEDGGQILLAEQFDFRQTSDYVTQSGDFKNTKKYTNNFYYEDVMALKINPDGTMGWISYARKNQISQNDNGYWSSYASFYKDSKLYLIYNDHPKNIDSENPNRMFQYEASKKGDTL